MRVPHADTVSRPSPSPSHPTLNPPGDPAADASKQSKHSHDATAERFLGSPLYSWVLLGGGLGCSTLLALQRGGAAPGSVAASWLPSVVLAIWSGLTFVWVQRLETVRRRASSAHRKTEASLRQAAEQFRRAFDNAGIGMAIAGLDRRLLRVNDAFRRMLGAPAGEDLIGRAILELTHPDDRAVNQQALTSLFADPSTRLAMEKRYLHQDGHAVWAMTTSSVVCDDAGRPSYVIAQIQDITEQRRAVERLRWNEERLRAIVETIEEVFWIARPGDVQATYVSPAARKIWGHPPERFLQNPRLVLETIHPEDRASFREAIERQARGLRTSIEYRILHADGTVRWVWDQGFPVLDAAGVLTAVNGLATDITERRSLEAQLRQAQKIEAIGTLAGGIAHEFNNILGSIIGFTELARLDVRGDGEVTQNLNEVLRASRRAAELVRQILTFSRQQGAERRPVQLAPIVRAASQLLRATAPASIEFELDLPENLPDVMADPTQLQQVVMNLGTNAIQSIHPSHGAIQLRLEPFTVDDDWARNHPGLTTGPHIRLTITDSGSGIDPESAEHVFEPFFTTKAPGEGSGLGLSVVHGIVKHHHGSVTLSSRPGAGTTVAVVLPARAGAGPVAAAPALDPQLMTPSRRGGGEHVLFIDDEPDLGVVGKRALERYGYRVTVLTDPIAALAEFQRSPDSYDVVITDLTMPAMGGADLAARIRRLRPQLPILMTTGHGTTLNADQARQLGIRGVLIKPTDNETLGGAVQRALEETYATKSHHSGPHPSVHSRRAGD